MDTLIQQTHMNLDWYNTEAAVNVVPADATAFAPNTWKGAVASLRPAFCHRRMLQGMLKPSHACSRASYPKGRMA